MAAYQNSDLRDDAACAIGFGSVYWMYNHQPGSDPEMPGSQLFGNFPSRRGRDRQVTENAVFPALQKQQA